MLLSARRQLHLKFSVNDELLSAITLNATLGCILWSRDLGRLWECFVLPPQSLTAWDLSLIAAVLPLRSAWTPSLSIHPFTHNPKPGSLPSSNQNGCSVEKPPEPWQHKPEVQHEPETLPGGCPSPGGPAIPTHLGNPGRSKPWKYHGLSHGSVSPLSIEPGAASLSTEDEIPAERSQVRARALPAAQGLPLHMPRESSRRYQSHYKPNGCLIASAPISLKPDQHGALNSSTCKS